MLQISSSLIRLSVRDEVSPQKLIFMEPFDAKEYKLPDTWTLRAHCESNERTYKVSYFHVMDLKNIYDWVILRNSLHPGKVFSCSNVNYRLQDKTITSLSLFKDDIRPEWEDPHNEGGFTCSIRGAFSESVIDQLWDDLVLDAVRGGLEEHIMGILIT